MTWRDDLRRVTLPDGRQLIGASFRGIAFFVDTAERGGGRRAVVHEFPLRDDPFVEDLGRHARTFRVDGYVLGDDYLTQRDALLVALEDTDGPGELVHPYHGVRRAICTNVTVRENRGEGGIAMFAIEFAETPTQAPVPVEIVDSAEQVDTDADNARTAVNAEFIEKYDVSGMPSFALASAETALTNATNALKDKLSPITSATQELATMTGQVALITSETSSLVRQPASVLGQFAAVISALAETAGDVPGAVVDALIDAYAVDLGATVTGTTATREQEATNQAALTGALRSIIAIEAARMAPLVPYESIESAMATRDAIAGMLEAQADLAGDTAYPSIVDLRSALLRGIPGSTEFARIITVERGVAVPSLLLTYQLYGSVDNEADVIARNGVSNPGFIAGSLKVLSSV